MVTQELRLADYFESVHKLISRGVEISIQWNNFFIQEGFPDGITQKGYLNYIRALTLLIDSHHKTEDDIAFPYFHKVLPETHFNWLDEDHNLITGFLDDLAPIYEYLGRSEQVHKNLGLLMDVLLKIEDRWTQHIELEEEEFVDLIDALSTDEEKANLFTQFAEYSHNLLAPHPLTLPFMLYNLEPLDRQVIINTHPKGWFDQVDTPEWKKLRQSMTQFLLSD